ncbi:MAG: CHAT domain-containing protein [Microcoleaceae cyanobacterium]
MTQEFRVSVTPIGNDEYLVRTEHVASGVPLAEEQVRWPVSAWQSSASQLLNDPLLSLLEGGSSHQLRHHSGQSSASPTTPEELTLSLVELGQELYNGLFQGTMRDSWTCAQAIAQNRRELLQLRLGVKGQQLSSLPWEVLHAGDRPLSTGTDVVFSRYQPGTGSIIDAFTQFPNQPLKILVVIAAPNDQDGLRLKQEVLHLQKELRYEGKSFELHPFDPPNGNPEIQLKILEQPDRELLTQTLEQGQYQVFHYAGHSSASPAGGKLYLVNRRTGSAEFLSGEDLAGLLVNNGVQMAVLNSCRGAYGSRVRSAVRAVPDESSENGAFSLAETLVKRGIPGVLAMAERIPDEVALTLTRLLYRNLNQGYPVDLSLSRARQGLISAYGSHQLYWALPILYLHLEFDGCLIARPAKSASDSEAQFPVRVVPLNSGEPSSKKQLASLETLPSEFDFSFVRSASASFPNVAWDEEDDSVDTIEQFSDEPLEMSNGYIDEYGFDEEDEALDFISDELRRLQTIDPQNSSPIVHPNGSAPAATSDPQRLKRPALPARKSRYPRQKILLSAILALIPLGWGIWLFQNRWTQSKSVTLPPESSVQAEANGLTTKQTNDVLGIAIEQFGKSNRAAAVEATAELLSRGALPEATAALAAVPISMQDTPEINFLRGRLAWQSIQQGTTEYTINDVRRYWARAVQQDPTSLKYQNALGFAYYSEGKLDRAYETWIKVLEQAEPDLADSRFTGESSGRSGSNKSGSTNVSTTESAQPLDQVAQKQQALIAYAGLGLALMKSAETLPPEEQALRHAKAAKFHNKVLNEAQNLFQIEVLGRQWLWSSDLVQDWQLLTRLSLVEAASETPNQPQPNSGQ